MANRKKLVDDMKVNNAITVQQTKEETGAQAFARKLLQPTLKNAAAASAFTGKMLGNNQEMPGIGDYADHVQVAACDAAGGDITMASRILAAQAITLDSMFAELARRTAMNMSEYIDASERYGRLALKAQSNCRATLEALAKLHQPREQTVRHVHVNDGGQAIVTDQFHHHTGGAENAKTVEQSHAAGTACNSSAMLGQNTAGNGMPITSRKGKAAMQDALRD